MSAQDPSSPPWWQAGVVYQVYPRSFQDSDGDGVGDLPGVLARLDHLVWLGVDAIWLSPIFPSPMADFGYDVSDYTDVAAVFGTLDDVDRLIAAAHGRGIRILLDFVPNHTSDQHPWFVAARSSRDDPKRDWYLWADPRPDGSPPNGWQSMFGGPAWTLDEATGQYYYHAFLAEQPDLDWRNPAVVAAMLDVLRFWLDRGIDGFRIDVLWLLLKDTAWATAEDPERPWANRADHEGMADIVARLRSTIDAYPGDRVLIGEIYLPLERLMAYYGTAALPGIHLPFNFQLITSAWDAATVRGMIAAYEAALPDGAWPNWVLGNHDQRRIATRVGPAQARVAAMLLLTLRGTPTVYYGDEIGTRDVVVPPDRRVDPAEPSRDPTRVPMRWDASPAGGFTTGEAWLPVSPADGPDVASQRADPTSMLALHRRLLELRRSEPALAVGSWRGLDGPDGTVVYERAAADGRRFLVALGLDGKAHRSVVSGVRGVIVVDTGMRRAGERVDGALDLAPDEGVVVALDPA
jgi:alpha-glucosidase